MQIKINDEVYAGKILHETLINPQDLGVENVQRKFMQECELMSKLNSPYITRFHGVCFFSDLRLPVLVMERLDRNLHDLLEQGNSNLSLELKLSIISNVANGLIYLHANNPVIIHRDLTAMNILLTESLVAKISDFGSSRIVNLQPGQLARTLSRLPGTLVYMPPEAVSASSHYGPSLDVFSFGHLALFVLLQVYTSTANTHQLCS